MSVIASETPPNATVFIAGRWRDYFCGCSYFALHGHPAVVRAGRKALEQFGISTGTSRTGFGNNFYFRHLEEQAARFFGAESAFYYVSGYFGNGILLKGLAHAYDVIFMDEQSHYSVRDGAALAGKKVVQFSHRCAEDLQRKLASTLGPADVPLVICDGVFPTSGQVSPLDDYDHLLASYNNAILCVDDAHAYGVLGETGRGTLELFGLQGKQYRYSCGTFSKAFGGHGGVITGSQAFIEMLIANTHLLPGAGAVPIPIAAATLKGLEIIRGQPSLRNRLWDNVAYAKDIFRSLGFMNISETSVPIICLTAAGVKFDKLQRYLFSQGIVVQYVAPGSYTSAPQGGCLRIAIFSSHERAQIDRLASMIKAWLSENNAH